MRHVGKCLSLFLLFISSANAQVLLVPPQSATPAPYEFHIYPQEPERKELAGIDLDLNSIVSDEIWGNCLQADVWVLIDYSGSMSGFEETTAEALVSVANGIIENDSNRRMGFISFNGEPTLRLALTNSKKDAYAAILKFSKIPAGGGTSIYDGLASVPTHQAISPPNKNANENGFKKILILISDGIDTGRDEIIGKANEMKKDGWWIYSIMATKDEIQGPLDDNWHYQLLRDISGNPSDSTESYVDSILLSDLPEHFSQRFSCL